MIENQRPFYNWITPAMTPVNGKPTDPWVLLQEYWFLVGRTTAIFKPDLLIHLNYTPVKFCGFILHGYDAFAYSKFVHRRTDRHLANARNCFCCSLCYNRPLDPFGRQMWARSVRWGEGTLLQAPLPGPWQSLNLALHFSATTHL